MTLAPRAATAATLICGVVTGITMVALHFRRWADNATPCAWLPAEAAMTPRASAAGERRDILLYAPRSLNENTDCMSSRFNNNVLLSRADRLEARSSGVSIATS